MDDGVNFEFASLVIAGQWNTAVLNDPGWVARHVQQISEGESIEVRTILSGDPADPIPYSAKNRMWDFGDFILNCDEHRVTFMTHNIDAVRGIYDAVKNLINVLTYTPISAVGVNFSAHLSEGLVAITPSFETKESLEYFGNSLEQSRTDCLEIDRDRLPEISDVGKPRTVLNITRKNNYEEVEIEMNYHVKIYNTSMLSSYIEVDPINHWMKHAENLLRKIYYIDI